MENSACRRRMADSRQAGSDFLEALSRSRTFAQGDCRHTGGCESAGHDWLGGICGFAVTVMS